MEIGIFAKYFIGINIVGFILFAINTWLYSHTEKGQVDLFLTLTALAGGSLGILCGIFLIDRKAEKGNMMSRVFIACIFVIQIILLLVLNGKHAEHITFAFWEFFGKYKMLLTYLLIINIVTLIAYAIDKINACEGRSRIRIVTLLGLAFIGGSIGAIAAMYLFRHKTRQDYFAVGVPLIIITQVIVIFYLMNAA